MCSLACMNPLTPFAVTGSWWLARLAASCLFQRASTASNSGPFVGSERAHATKATPRALSTAVDLAPPSPELRAGCPDSLKGSMCPAGGGCRGRTPDAAEAFTPDVSFADLVERQPGLRLVPDLASLSGLPLVSIPATAIVLSSEPPLLLPNSPSTTTSHATRNRLSSPTSSIKTTKAASQASSRPSQAPSKASIVPSKPLHPDLESRTTSATEPSLSSTFASHFSQETSSTASSPTRPSEQNITHSLLSTATESTAAPGREARISMTSAGENSATEAASVWMTGDPEDFVHVQGRAVGMTVGFLGGVGHQATSHTGFAFGVLTTRDRNCIRRHRNCPHLLPSSQENEQKEMVKHGRPGKASATDGRRGKSRVEGQDGCQGRRSGAGSSGPTGRG